MLDEDWQPSISMNAEDVARSTKMQGRKPRCRVAHSYNRVRPPPLIWLGESRLGWAADAPGVTDTEIKIGQTMPYSGPVSAYGIIGRTEAAYFQMINEQGGVNGRKLNLISLDDAYSPPKTVEQIRRTRGAGAGRLHIQQPWYAIEFGDPAISQRL